MGAGWLLLTEDFFINDDMGLNTVRLSYWDNLIGLFMRFPVYVEFLMNRIGAESEININRIEMFLKANFVKYRVHSNEK